jgi:hypothetical protein
MACGESRGWDHPKDASAGPFPERHHVLPHELTLWVGEDAVTKVSQAVERRDRVPEDAHDALRVPAFRETVIGGYGSHHEREKERCPREHAWPRRAFFGVPRLQAAPDGANVEPAALDAQHCMSLRDVAAARW